jgi:hypothetical protein
LGESKKDIPLFIKLSSSNGKVYDVFGDILYPSKSFCKIFAMIESNEGLDCLPTIIMTDNFGQVQEFDLNMIPPNSHIGPFLDIIIQTKYIKICNFDKMQEIKGQINLKMEKLHYIQYSIDMLRAKIESGCKITDTDTATEREEKNSTKISLAEEIKKNEIHIDSIKEDIKKLIVDRRTRLI